MKKKKETTDEWMDSTNTFWEILQHLFVPAIRELWVPLSRGWIPGAGSGDCPGAPHMLHHKDQDSPQAISQVSETVII